MGKKGRTVSSQKGFTAMKYQTVLAVAALVLTAACAQPPGSITPVAISASDYDGISCARLTAQINDNQRALSDAESRQRNHVAGDAAGVFFILIPPSAFTGDASDEVALAKGEDRAMRLAYDNRCT
jgi:hypothetical protein